ncbi:MAG: TasA family protein [Lachnospiraceae bacterium]|nr:TasA family protein [Lachnospiraceae bacterium]
MNKKRFAAILTLLTLTLSLTIGGSIAYLTDSEHTDNHFTVGKVDIKLTEPNWKEDENQELQAGVTIAKDPTLTNTGINDAYVYLEVQIPMADVITAAADGTRLNKGAAAHQPLFTFQADKNWSLISQQESDNHMVYTYSYNEILEPGQSTSALFKTVTFANVIEGQIDGADFDIPVAGFAIQTAHTGDGSGDIPSEAKTAYNKYINQNLNQSGAAAK